MRAVVESTSSSIGHSARIIRKPLATGSLTQISCVNESEETSIMTEKGLQIQGPLTGSIEATIDDNDGPPASVLEASKDIEVTCKWEVDPFTASIMGGIWEIDLYAEVMGAGFEGHVATEDVAVVGDQTAYEVVVTVSAGTFPNDPPPPPSGGLSGAYRLVLVLTHKNIGGATTSIAGFVELPMLLIR
jgi:hypothetical protein